MNRVKVDVCGPDRVAIYDPTKPLPNLFNWFLHSTGRQGILLFFLVFPIMTSIGLIAHIYIWVCVFIVLPPFIILLLIYWCLNNSVHAGTQSKGIYISYAKMRGPLRRVYKDIAHAAFVDIWNDCLSNTTYNQILTLFNTYAEPQPDEDVKVKESQAAKYFLEVDDV